MIADRFDGLPTGPCRVCGARTITRARLQRPGWLRLLAGRAPLQWFCPPCLGRALEGGRHRAR